MTQQVLICSTKDNCVRSECVGWTANDSGKVKQNVHIGLTPGFGRFYSYETVLHAMGDGWKLLAPPTSYVVETDNGPIKEWEWWLVREPK